MHIHKNFCQQGGGKMEKILQELPVGSVDLLCIDCNQTYEFFNRRFYNAPNEPPKCPHCGSTNWKRVWLNMPQTHVQKYHPYATADRLHAPVDLPSHIRRTFSDSECQAMATAHTLNTGERVDWQDVKKEVNTKIWGFNK